MYPLNKKRERWLCQSLFIVNNICCSGGLCDPWTSCISQQKGMLPSILNNVESLYLRMLCSTIAWFMLIGSGEVWSMYFYISCYYLFLGKCMNMNSFNLGIMCAMFLFIWIISLLHVTYQFFRQVGSDRFIS